MGFEVLDRRHAPMRGTPSVTFQKRGIVSINDSMHALIKRASVVELPFDPERRVMALRPAKPSMLSYELRAPTKTGQTVLSTIAFMDAFKVDTSVSRRYEPFAEDGMLCLNFAGHSPEVHGNRSSVHPKPEVDRK